VIQCTLKAESNNNPNANSLSNKTNLAEENINKKSSATTNDYSPILYKGNQITYKSLNVNLTQNKVEIITDAAQNDIPFDMAQNMSSDVMRDSVASSLFAKSFLEKFFNGETDLSVEEEHLLDENSKTEHKNKQNNAEEFIDKLFNMVPEKTKSQSKADFNKNGLNKIEHPISSEIETLETYGLKATNSNKICIESLVLVRNQLFSNAEIISVYLKIHQLLNNSQIAFVFGNRTNLSTCDCILNCLDCCFFKLSRSEIFDQKCVENCCGECKSEINRETVYQKKLGYLQNKHSNSEETHDLFKNLLSASNLLYEPKTSEFFAKFYSNNRCKCLKRNSFTCCLRALYENIENIKNGKLPQSFQDYRCCGNCEQFEIDSVDTNNEERLKNNETILSTKHHLNGLTTPSNDSRILQTEVKTDQSEIMFEKEKQSISQKSKENASVAKPKSFKPTLSLTPRKTIIKTKQASESVKEPFSSVRSSKGKTVHFIEDPKYGFLPVKLSD